MFWKKPKNSVQEYLFDFHKMNFVVSRIMQEYLLQGKLKDYNESFLIVCDKDRSDNKISLNYTLEQLGHIANQNEGDNPEGLTFRDFANPFDLLDKSQWFARVNYNEPITIISDDKKTEYRLLLPHHQKSSAYPEASICHFSDKMNVYFGGPFQSDKLSQDKILISDIDSKRLDEMVRKTYKGRIFETYE
jgi:hypothetical protein